MGKTPVNTSVKYLDFGEKLPVQPIIHFQKGDTMRLVKNHIMFCPLRGANKKVPAYGLL